jgi:hypothetical protein
MVVEAKRGEKLGKWRGRGGTAYFVMKAENTVKSCRIAALTNSPAVRGS